MVSSASSLPTTTTTTTKHPLEAKKSWEHHLQQQQQQQQQRRRRQMEASDDENGTGRKDAPSSSTSSPSSFVRTSTDVNEVRGREGDNNNNKDNINLKRILWNDISHPLFKEPPMSSNPIHASREKKILLADDEDTVHGLMIDAGSVSATIITVIVLFVVVVLCSFGVANLFRY
jgi:hypothetical protein